MAARLVLPCPPCPPHPTRSACPCADDALRHIAAICGPRYNPGSGEVKLTADRYPHREANRAHILRIIDDLVAEGHRRHPAPQQQQAAAEAAA
jgi:hypothetical protein